MTVSPANVGVVKVNGVNYTPNCGYATNQVLSLEAVATNSLYKLGSWGGALSGSTNPVNLTMNVSKIVTATFVLNTTSKTLQGAKTLIDSGPEVLILDVSSTSNFEASHMLCAKNYVWNNGSNSFSNSITNLSPYKEDDILIYEQNGTNTAAAAAYLAGQGFTSIYYMTDGLNDWDAEGYEIFMTAEDGGKCTSLSPMAYAGPDQTDEKSVDEKQLVTLEGSSSTIGAKYAWLQVGGINNVTLSDLTAPRPTFTVPDLNGRDDTLVFQLTVTDAGKTDTDRVSVDVNSNNVKPSANAGSPQTVTPGTLVSLDGSGSTDPENPIKSYQWRVDGAKGLNPSLSNASTVSPSFTVPNTATDGSWVICELTVTDNGGLTDTDTVKITIQAEVVDPNDPPDANAGVEQTVTEGQTVTLSGSGSDSDGTIDSYSWSQSGTPAVTLSGASTAQATFSAPDVSASTVLTFTLTVTDNDGATDTDTVTVTVNDDGVTPPPVQNETPTANAGADQSVEEAKVVSLDGSGSTDPDGTIDSYAWTQTDSTGVTVALSSNSTAKPTFTAPDVDAATTLTFALVVTDNEGAASLADTVGIIITAASSGGGGGGGCFINSLAD